MEYDLIYPQDESLAKHVPCVVAAAYFDRDELIGLGVDPASYEVNACFVEDNEFSKPFNLWGSPKYLKEFFNKNLDFFKQEYWNDITEEEFVEDVTKSLNRIRREFIDLFNNHALHTKVEPLEPKEEDQRLHKSIRVKIKQGYIHGRYAFRFYAIEIEENKCYLITGATIKVHKDMLKAPNTSIEMAKLEYALKELSSESIDTKDAFIGF
ncbi:MAG: hypothetical protein K2K72_04745 [Duncaniella sp.]|nr:hypothetical protein [Duncaniella sp.]